MKNSLNRFTTSALKLLVNAHCKQNGVSAPFTLSGLKSWTQLPLPLGPRLPPYYLCSARLVSRVTKRAQFLSLTLHHSFLCLPFSFFRFKCHLVRWNPGTFS